MHKVCDIDGVDDQTLECLIGWEPGTVGWRIEKDAIHQLNSLCQQLGYGRIHQMATAILEIWQDPEAIEEFVERQEDRYDFLQNRKKGIVYYDPKFGDDELCKCGHVYYRHFDTYENMELVGCKYCECDEFHQRYKDVDK